MDNLQEKPGKHKQRTLPRHQGKEQVFLDKGFSFVCPHSEWLLHAAIETGMM
jgi:hypothetical protein